MEKFYPRQLKITLSCKLSNVIVKAILLDKSNTDTENIFLFFLYLQSHTFVNSTNVNNKIMGHLQNI